MENKDGKFVWSHSSSSMLISNPAEFFLNYIEGIKPITESKALAIGSAVHHGIEVNDSNLDAYVKETGGFEAVGGYSTEQLLAECMVEAYLKKKDQLFDQILTMKDGTKAKLLEEMHEIKLDEKIGDNLFTGIIDLLLLVEWNGKKYFIVVDYKTSSMEPSYEQYLDQVYRYIYLLKKEFPDVPVVKIGIINLRKTMIRPKKNENEESYRNRIRIEYDNENLVNYFEYLQEDLDPIRLQAYFSNLERTVNFVQSVYDNKQWFINYAALTSKYGKSQYYDIFMHTPDAHQLFKIKDTIINEENWNEEELTEYRPCLPIDMEVLEKTNVMNHYKKYKELYKKAESNPLFSKDEFTKEVKKDYLTDDSLLESYNKTIEFEKKKGIF